MGKVVRNLKSFSGSLLMLAVMLVALFFALNWAAQRGWGPFSTAAGWVESHANGTVYGGGGGAPVVVGVPSNGPSL